MSNYPHSSSIATSLSSSPYAVHNNLENLINRSRSHPHPRRASEPEDPLPHGLAPSHRSPRIGTIPESLDNGASILLDADDVDERAALLPSRRESRSRRKSYGTLEPLGSRVSRFETSHARSGSSRSRSKARTPPRNGRVKPHKGEAESSTGDDSDRRGRPTESRPLSRASSPVTSHRTSSIRFRRASVVNRRADDSSADEDSDVVRGIVVAGGGAILGGRSGLSAAGIMDLDPVEELDASDLEVPTDAQGLEVRAWREALRAETPVLIRSAIPVFLTQMAEWSLVLASTVSIGHLGTTDLAAATLSSMTAAVSSFSILQGLATALDTLLPAAFTSSDPSRVGLWTQRMSVVIVFSMIPMFVLWWNVEGILLALGQEHDVAEKAALYLRYLSFGIPGYGGNVVVKKYLQSQNLMHVPTYILFIVAPINLLMNWLFVWGPDAVRLGFVGGAVATAISYNLTFVLAATWALVYGPREAFHPVKFKHMFSKLGTCTSLGLAGTIMLSSEWWAWEVCALAASYLGPTTLAAQSVVLSTASTFYQVPAALGVASAVRCGNLLGAGRGWEAKWASRASMILGVLFAVLNSIILIVARKNWGYLFNSDPEVILIVAQILPYIALFQITDGVTATTGSILRALGLHTTGALINLTSYYIIGLPFGLWLCFSDHIHLGLVGIWIGLSVALGYATVVSVVLVWTANWTRAVERVRERLGLGAFGEIGEDGKWGSQGEIRPEGV
ncbi:mate-domain-containing protein [Naematelia encephala]|uniref:Mate-domain-containing protein n=1 Tax=Naematelia encephala TaxID=71784 RepID=A0A1Y2AT27_9TREE|nr:mate-domain-containing protein [Naematelia encephala]